ncbi:unnamed protein product, partial [Choristocarpus tenellus]
SRCGELEQEVVDLKAKVKTLEMHGPLDLKAEQARSMEKLTQAEKLWQVDLQAQDAQHREALAELKKVHKQEIEGVRQRASDSLSLEALAQQVHAGAGALKLLQSELVDRKGAAEVRREGHMEARERLIQELENNAKRTQQSAEEELQRFQGALMSMDQVEE